MEKTSPILKETPANSATEPAVKPSTVQKIDLASIRRTIGYFPLPWQIQALQLLNKPDCQFLIIPGGKRVGKTNFCADIGNSYLHLPLSKGWLIAPSYDLGYRIWDYNKLWADLHFPYLKPTSANNQPQITNESTGAWFKVKTADSTGNLKGEGLWYAIFDEGPDMPDEIWYQYIQPNVRQAYYYMGQARKPKVIIVGNPQGKNWVWEMYQRALRGEPGYYCLHVPTAIEDAEGNVIGTNNPLAFPDLEELWRIKETTPYHIWKSDYLAQFREDEGNIFKNLFRVVGGENWKKRKPNHRYIIGWDPAKHRDFNVLTVIDYHTHEVVDFSRSNKLDYVFQKQRLLSFVKEYGGRSCEVVIDSTGLGEPLFDELARAGISVYDFQFTQKSKKDLVEKLALFIDHVRLRIPKVPELQPLWDELENFGSLDRNGRLKYEAPQGKHDDCVFSLALAVYRLESQMLDDSPIKEEMRRISLQKSKNIQFNYK